MNYSELFHESYARVVLDKERAEKLVSVFYERLLARSARLRELFSGINMEHQRQHLRLGLVTVGTFLSTGLKSTREMDRLAEIHRALGLTPADYQDWLDALIEAIAEVDAPLRPEVADAWRIAVAPALVFMQLPSRRSVEASSRSHPH